MDSNITINIVEPGSSTPAVPDTGLFTNGIGGPEAAIIATIATAALLALLGAVIYYRKKKQGKTPSQLTKFKLRRIFKYKKAAVTGLSIMAVVVFLGTFATLLRNGANAEEPANGALTVTAEDIDLTIELSDKPVFVVAPSKVTVEEATLAGYTLRAYASEPTLSSTTTDKTISLVTLPEDELDNAGSLTSSLTDNTWGIATEEPESKEDEIFYYLPETADDAIAIKSTSTYSPTEENDTTTIYYGFYITPDIPYGTYTGAVVEYNATINTTLVTFNSNGLYFNNDEQQTTNEVEYIAVPAEENNDSEGTINQIISGEYLEPSQTLPYIFLGWDTDGQATTPTYTSEEDLAENLPIMPNQPVTLYAIWQKATALSFNGNGSDGGEAINTRTIAAGDTITLPPNTYTKEGYNFTGWNTEADGSGDSYENEADYTAAADQSANVTLYAQWKENALYMQDVAAWGNTLQQGDEITVVDSRDGKGYTVARLADGNIWMTQNLDFDIVDGGADLDSTNTDVPSDWADAGSLINTHNYTTWNSSATTPESYDPGNLYWNGEFNENGDGTLDNMTSSTGDSHYHIGNYYNWTAAVAMGNSSSYTTDEQDVNQSICPAGWRLPTYSGDKSYDSLISAQNLTAGADGNIQSAPVYFVYGGFWNGNFTGFGSGGGYWSSVVSVSGHSYRLGFGERGVGSQSLGIRGNGYSLRCVAR